MRRKSKPGSFYPPDWLEISCKAKDRAGNRCERCGRYHDYESGYVLTVHHLDMNPDNNADWNLAVLCQRCHLSVQNRVNMYQGYLLEHSEWMKPHVEGFMKAMEVKNETETAPPGAGGMGG